MHYEWDESKNRANQFKHGVAFGAAENFCWDTALETIDDREDYGEERYVALGLIGPRVYVLIFTKRGQNIRIISLRKANQREREAYEHNR